MSLGVKVFAMSSSFDLLISGVLSLVLIPKIDMVAVWGPNLVSLMRSLFEFWKMPEIQKAWYLVNLGVIDVSQGDRKYYHFQWLASSW